VDVSAIFFILRAEHVKVAITFFCIAPSSGITIFARPSSDFVDFIL
jgi:hypothetical protein